MSETAVARSFPSPWVKEKIFLGMEVKDYLRSLLTPFNAVAALILAFGIPVMVLRFVKGLGAVTNLSQTNPWGLWVAFDVVCGVALAAGGYTIACTVVIFGQKKYAPILRPAILTGFLGYLFVVIGLLFDLGQPWRLPYPLTWTHGTTAVMYEVAWCVALYLTVLFYEFLPAILEWLGLTKLRALVLKASIAVIVLGVVLSTLHQSSLGAFFLMVPDKLHPLWYSPFIPIYFFISSICGGLGMVIVESGLSHRAFRDQHDPQKPVDLDGLTLGLARGAAVVLFAYFFIRLQGLADGGTWHLLLTGWGAWWAVEMIGFVLVPSFLFAYAARNGRASIARFAGAMTVVGVILNRFNISWTALNWNAPDRYVPSAAEVLLSLTLLTIGVLVFRWIVNRMPVLREHPAYPPAH